MTAARPVLGIACCTRIVEPEPAQAVMNRYVRAAMKFADCAALLVPAMPDLMSAQEVAPRLDGLLLTGSPSNLQPHRYGEAIDDAPGPFDPGRDEITLSLAKAMMDLGKPVFGVCRGLQELNVAFGGALRRDTSENPDLIAHHAPLDVSFDAMFDHFHPVALTPGGVLARSLGRTELTVNSVHFQGIGRLGSGLKVEAVAPDGVVEAISTEINGAPVVAVQWHPEWQVEANPDSQGFFRLLGRALRGELAASDLRTAS
ncbi:gamma-glutamyl-gamma-aminobutyrate hydrolase family protein [Phenylobacterium montanum]|uniref:gamma-glutamyl-gamma-aminobutyrate hydrolase n=1 Tax=Phenylobacterium montanum TaxID=2823693 RepID=A0A975IUQ3_9CAUL|nr:gamma-glutamyl-gamma-aminobutyrate hydrolase family protein [Caulobacter sp. S6]QUD88202.1 gamma-glutamyl-gamma-aminobutyrate hydrolase family protein [Caulobacter sp. S6]